MICSQYVPRPEMSRSAIWNFLCSSQHPYPPRVRTKLILGGRVAVLNMGYLKFFSKDFYDVLLFPSGFEVSVFCEKFGLVELSEHVPP